MNISSAAGFLGRPGIVIISPHTTTINPAPDRSLTSLIGILKPSGAPKSLGQAEKLYCVLPCKLVNFRQIFQLIQLINYFFINYNIISSINIFNNLPNFLNYFIIIFIQKLELFFSLHISTTLLARFIDIF